jgi:hypothetical protein
MNSMNNVLASTSLAFALMFSVPTIAAPAGSGGAIAAAADTLSIVESVGGRRCDVPNPPFSCRLTKIQQPSYITNIHINRPSVPQTSTTVPKHPPRP